MSNSRSNDSDDEQDLSSTAYFDANRSREKKMAFVFNGFRLLVVLVLAPIIYFTV